MNDSNSKELRELIAKLSDGMLTPGDAARLNQVLKEDGIAQQVYLDHLLVDGLLEREFGGSAGPGHAPLAGDTSSLHAPQVVAGESASRMTGRRFWFRRWRTVAAPSAILLVLVVGFCGWWSFSTTSPDVNQSLPLGLSNSGFESGAPHQGIASSEGVWFGDSVEVVGPVSKVDPLEGTRMLRFIDRDVVRDGSAVYQLVDLGPWEKALGSGDVSVLASAHFNAAIDDDDDPRMFSIRLYAFPEKPVCVPGVEPLGWGRPLVFAGRHFEADTDVDSWQSAAAYLELTPAARYLVVQLSVIDPDSEPEDDPEHYFVDKVAVSLVTSR